LHRHADFVWFRIILTGGICLMEAWLMVMAL
jgi:hypothetical protein